MDRVAPQLDLFTISAVDPPLRDNRDAMGYPFLSLQKRRTAPIEYHDKDVHISVDSDRRFSIATIWDWDIIIFAASHINEAIEQGLQVSPRIRFAPHDALRQIRRTTGGRDYAELAMGIKRLAATLVITNIRFEDQPGRGGQLGFHWLSGFWIPARYQFACRDGTRSTAPITPNNPAGEPDPTQPWAIELPPWLYNAILHRRDILAVHPAYFELSSGIERWLYRLARKAVPDKAKIPAIAFRLETLFARSGLTGRPRQFRAKLEDIEARQPLPEYDVGITSDGPHVRVTLMRNRAKPGRLPRGLLSIAG